MILVDSSIWISTLHGVEDAHTARFHDAVRTGDVAVGDLVLLEVLRGARSETAARRFEVLMAAFPVVPLGGRRLASAAAANYRALRAKGITIRSSIDVLIATYCIAGGHALLHKDRDFGHFEALGLARY